MRRFHDHGDTEWRSVIRQLLAQGLIGVEGDYGTLVLTDASAEVLGRKRVVMMRTEKERAVKAAKPSSSRGGAKAAAVELAPDAADRLPVPDSGATGNHCPLRSRGRYGLRQILR